MGGASVELLATPGVLLSVLYPPDPGAGVR